VDEDKLINWLIDVKQPVNNGWLLLEIADVDVPGVALSLRVTLCDPLISINSLDEMRLWFCLAVVEAADCYHAVRRNVKFPNQWDIPWTDGYSKKSNVIRRWTIIVL